MTCYQTPSRCLQSIVAFPTWAGHQVHSLSAIQCQGKYKVKAETDEYVGLNYSVIWAFGELGLRKGQMISNADAVMSCIPTHCFEIPTLNAVSSGSHSSFPGKIVF